MEKVLVSLLLVAVIYAVLALGTVIRYVRKHKKQQRHLEQLKATSQEARELLEKGKEHTNGKWN